MTPIKRVQSLLEGRSVDRVTVWLWLISSPFASRNVGYTIASSYRDPEISFWSQMWTQEMYGSDDIPRPAFGGTVSNTWAFGGEIKWPEGDYSQAPTAIRYPVESEEDVWNLKVPDDIRTSGPIPRYIQFSELQEKFGFPISLPCDAPLETVRGLCGVELLCRWLLKKPDVIHYLLRLAMDYQLAVVRYWVNRFESKNILAQNAVPTSSNQVISPRQFAEFFLPYEVELHKKILAMGVKHIFCHVCGDQNLNLEYWKDIPMGDPGILSFGNEVDLITATKYFGDKCIIAGNISPTIIQSGTPHEVYELSRQCIEKAKYSPRGFILTPGCGLSPMAPPYNVYMMKKAVSDLGWYH